MRQTLARLGGVGPGDVASWTDNKGKPRPVRLGAPAALLGSLPLACGALSEAENYARASLSRSLDRRAFPEPAAPFIPTHVVSEGSQTTWLAAETERENRETE